MLDYFDDRLVRLFADASWVIVTNFDPKWIYTARCDYTVFGRKNNNNYANIVILDPIKTCFK